MTINPEDLGRILSDVGIIPAIALTHAEVYDHQKIQNAVTMAASKLSVLEVNDEAARWRGIANRPANDLVPTKTQSLDVMDEIHTAHAIALRNSGQCTPGSVAWADWGIIERALQAAIKVMEQ